MPQLKNGVPCICFNSSHGVAYFCSFKGYCLSSKVSYLVQICLRFFQFPHPNFMNIKSQALKFFLFPFPSDIDECVTGKNLCPYNRQCVNTFGSYYCKCQEGYDLKYVDGKYDCVGKVYAFTTGKNICGSVLLLKVQIGFFQFQTMMSVQLAPTSAATTLTVWTLGDPTSAGASLASEAMALNALVRSKNCHTELWIHRLGMPFDM